MYCALLNRHGEEKAVLKKKKISHLYRKIKKKKAGEVTDTDVSLFKMIIACTTNWLDKQRNKLEKRKNIVSTNSITWSEEKGISKEREAFCKSALQRERKCGQVLVWKILSILWPWKVFNNSEVSRQCNNLCLMETTFSYHLIMSFKVSSVHQLL